MTTPPPPADDEMAPPAPEKVHQLDESPGTLPRDAHLSWIRRVGDVGIDVMRFMAFWAACFVGLDLQLEPRDRSPIGGPQRSHRAMVVIAATTFVLAAALAIVVLYLFYY